MSLIISYKCYNPQVFVLMQFDPGLEYKPASARGSSSGRNANTQGSGVGGGGSNKDDNS